MGVLHPFNITLALQSSKPSIVVHGDMMRTMFQIRELKSIYIRLNFSKIRINIIDPLEILILLRSGTPEKTEENDKLVVDGDFSNLQHYVRGKLWGILEWERIRDLDGDG